MRQRTYVRQRTYCVSVCVRAYVYACGRVCWGRGLVLNFRLFTLLRCRQRTAVCTPSLVHAARLEGSTEP